MPSRYVVYDVGEHTDDTQLRALLDGWKAEKITETSFRVNSPMALNAFCQRLKEATKNGDRLFVIYQGALKIEQWKVR